MLVRNDIEMPFTDEFLDSIPADPLLALDKMVKAILEFWKNLPTSEEAKNAEYFIEAAAILQAIVENQTFAPPEQLAVPAFNGDVKGFIDELIQYCAKNKEYLSSHLLLLKAAELGQKHRARFGGQFVYEFSDGDVRRIQDLINSLRDLIGKSDLFSPEHKRRVLLRLEKVQAEMHKKMSDLDRFWGLIGDAGVALGKFGNDAKPMVDRIREISEIVWRTQARAEELPSDTPLILLESKDIKGARK